MKKNTVYCRIEFIEDVIKVVSEQNVFFESDKTIYREILSFLGSDCSIFHDLDDNSFYEKAKTNKILRILLKNEQGAKTELVSSPEEFDSMVQNETYFEDKVSEIFFLGKNDKFNETLSNDYGLVSANINSVDNLNFLFDFSLFSCSKKGKIENWDFIKTQKHPFNAMVIADNYILSKKHLISDNLFILLDNLLPKALNKRKFDLTIIVEKDEKATFGSGLDIIYNEILDFCKSIRDYEINLSIIKTSKINLHDRNIITNYLWINSGYGFNLFKNERVIKETHLSAFPITYNNIPKNIDLGHYNNSAFQIHKSLIRQYAIIIEKAKNSENLMIDNEYQGDKQNRLFN